MKNDHIVNITNNIEKRQKLGRKYNIFSDVPIMLCESFHMFVKVIKNANHYQDA